MAYLWPEADAEHARHYLTVSIYELRRALGEDAILTSGDAVRLNPLVVSSDVARFEEAISAGDFERAVGLYRGPLLDGFHTTNAGELDRWIELERDRLARASLEALSRLAEQRAGLHDTAGTVEALRELVARNPLHSPGVLRLMEALDAAGDRAGALQAGDAHAAALDRELSAEPDPLVAAYAERLRSRPSRLPPPPGMADPPQAAGVSGDQERSRGLPLSERGLPRARRRLLLAPLSLALTAGLLFAGVALGSHRSDSSGLEPHRVVVAPFENRTGDSSLDLLGQLAADWITRGLAQTGLVAVADARAGLGSPGPTPGGEHQGASRTGLGSPEALRALVRQTGAGIVISGSLYRNGDTIGFETRITEARTGRILRAIDPVEGSVGDERAVVERLRQRVTGSLATVVDARLSNWVNIAGQPPSYEAYQELAEGVDAWKEVRSREALDHLHRAASLDSTYLLPRVIAARVHGWLNQCAEVDSIERAISASRVWPSAVEESLLDESLGICRGDPLRTYRASRRLADALPGSALAQARVAHYAAQIGRPREAVAILEKLDPAGPELEGWYPYYHWLTLSLHQLRDHHRELEAARRGRRQYPDNLALVRDEMFALVSLGRLPDVDRLLDTLAILPDGPVRHQGTIIVETALELRAHGHPAAAGAVLGRAFRWLESRPAAERSTLAWRFDLAQTLFVSGAVDSAYDMARQLAQVAPDSVAYEGLYGVLAAERGQRNEAARIDSLLAGATAPYQQGVPMYWQGAIALRLGDRQRAVALLSEALTRGLLDSVRAWRRMLAGPSLHSDPYFAPLLADFPAFEALLRPGG